MLRRFRQKLAQADLTTSYGRALVEERYWSLRRQVPIVFLLGFVNVSAMELVATGRLSVGINLPTFIALCWGVRLWQWFGRGSGRHATPEAMLRRIRQTVVVAAAVCIAVSIRCLYLLTAGDEVLKMAVMLFGGLTAVGVSYGLTAVPSAARIPLILIIIPISIAALLSNDPHFVGGAFALVVVAALTLRLISAHSRHFTSVIQSRSAIAGEQKRVEHAHQEAVIAATTDFLTGLPNRRAFVAALEVATSERRGSFAIAILDLDRFKPVNDTFGHATGDQLLKVVASRLVSVVGSRGLVARIGGDEFGVLLEHVRRPAEAQAIGSEILKCVNGPALLQGRPFTVSACCGIGMSRGSDDESPSRLMADADLALYQAKEDPRARLALFEQRMEAPRRRRADIERALQAPDARDNLRLAFQPIFDLKSGRIMAHEALARWLHPELGAVAPSEFVPIAEQLHLIDDINHHLMGIAFEAAHSWPDEIKLSFNLSAIQLCSGGSADNIIKALKTTGLAPQKLQVEVTETALLADIERARENLSALRDAGATIVLDDFGAGFASIGYLKELRFDQIKLDGGLVTAAQHSADGRRLLRAVIGLCQILGVSSIAEHVESEELLMLVMELGCSGAQGFWLERPVAFEELDSIEALKVLPLRNPGRRRNAA
jgi:diguanylate cyclase (GGDEF)-like protein